MTEADICLGRYKLGSSDEENHLYKPRRGLGENLIKEISWMKGEPEWMREFRLRAYEIYKRRPMPDWGGGASEIVLDDFSYYGKPNDRQLDAAAELPDSAYRKNREALARQGVLSCDMDTAVREYPEMVQAYIGSIIAPGDNKFAALNSAVWSGGSFIYVPPGVEVEMPLQAYSRIKTENMGQFERTLIIADEGSKVHYIEGCSAPVYTASSLHSAVVELLAKDHGRITYTTIQNWSPNVFNLGTKRAVAQEGAHVEWIDANIGSRLTMKHPSVCLAGRKASGEVLSVAYAGAGQHQDVGAKMMHTAPETTSKVVSKSISKDGGRTTYRGLVRVEADAHGCKSHMQCDALILDDESISDSDPFMEIETSDAVVGQEITASRVSAEQLFYLQSRGLTEEQATAMVVNGFIEPVTRTLPIEYAVEWSRLIELQLEGSIG